MSKNVQPWAWSAKKALAAQLLAEGLTYDAIAAKVGMSRRQLQRWEQSPEFAARVAETVEKLQATILNRGIARRARRVERLNDRWEKMQAVIDQRAADPLMQTVPGGTTGLIIKRTRSIGSGDNFQAVEEYTVDTLLLRELREHEKQAAQELGQWGERPTASPAGVTFSEILVLVKQALAHREAASVPSDIAPAPAITPAARALGGAKTVLGQTD